MRSIRLDDDLDAAVRVAADRRQQSVSQFIRDAAEERARAVLAQDARTQLGDILGSARCGRGIARRTGAAFTAELDRRRRRRR